jgi:hypothetical protein
MPVLPARFPLRLSGLLVAGQDSIIRLWDATTGALVREIQGE